MTLTARDRRALLILGAAVAATLIYVLAEEAGPSGAVASSSIPAAEQRLERLRKTAALVPARRQALDQVSAQLALREKRLLQAETAAQAQAQLLQLVRRLAQSQNPAVEIKASDMGAVRPLGEHYGEVLVSLMLDCGIEQLLNLLAELTQQQEAVATHELRIYAADPKRKTTNVRLTVSAVVPKRLVPEKKGAAF